MTPDRAVRPPHTFRLEPWSSAALPVASAGAAGPPRSAEGATEGAAEGTTGEVPQEAPRVMGFLHDLDEGTYDLRQRVLGAGLLGQPNRLVRLATWVRGRMRAGRRWLAQAAKLG